MAPPQPKTSKKRLRKRKRRAAESSSSSSSLSSSDDEQSHSVTVQVKMATIIEAPSSSSSSSSSDSEDSRTVRRTTAAGTSEVASVGDPKTTAQREESRSPSPVEPTLPSFLGSNTEGSSTAQSEKEKVMKERFRKYWMASVAEEFKSDLEELRKEPNMTTSRLAMLIDSLASGGSVFSSGAGDGPGGTVNEIEMVLGP